MVVEATMVGVRKFISCSSSIEALNRACSSCASHDLTNELTILWWWLIIVNILTNILEYAATLACRCLWRKYSQVLVNKRGYLAS
jgi:hypothetical protein